MGSISAEYDVTYWTEEGEGFIAGGGFSNSGDVTITLEGHENPSSLNPIKLKVGDTVKLGISGSYPEGGDVDGDPIAVTSFENARFIAVETMKDGKEPEVPLTLEEIDGEFYLKANYPGMAMSSVQGGDPLEGGFGTALPEIVILDRAEVTTTPTAKTGLIDNGTEHSLVDEGSATGGTMMYALGYDDQTEPDEKAWGKTSPVGTEARTYYVWYKVVGDADHSDSVAACVPVTITGIVTAPTINSKSYNGKVQTADVADTEFYTVVTNYGGRDVSEIGYPVVLTLTDSSIYKWSDSDDLTKILYFKITKVAAPAVNVPTLNAVTYNPEKTLANVMLSNGWVWKESATVPTVNNGGYDAVLAVDDANYDYTSVNGYDAQNHTVTRTVSLKVNKADISKTKVTFKKASYVFDGKAKEPGVKSVTFGDSTLVAGTDYNVSYKNNKKPGTATVIVTGRGNYTGTEKETFTISLAKVSGFSTSCHPAKGTFDARWKEVAGATSYELSWRKVGGKWSSKVVTGTSATIKDLKTGNCYEARVRAKAGSVTGAWSKSSGRWLKKVSSVKAQTGSEKGSIKVSWSKDAEATGGYVVQVCTKKDGTIVARKDVAAGKTFATVSGLESGKAYYVKVRPVRKVSNNTYVGVERYFKSTVKAK